MSYTTTISGTGVLGTTVTTTNDRTEAEAVANLAVAYYLDNGATGGNVARWDNVTLYLGSQDSVVTIVTKRGRA